MGFISIQSIHGICRWLWIMWTWLCTIIFQKIQKSRWRNEACNISLYNMHGYYTYFCMGNTSFIWWLSKSLGQPKFFIGKNCTYLFYVDGARSKIFWKLGIVLGRIMAGRNLHEKNCRKFSKNLKSGNLYGRIIFQEFLRREIFQEFSKNFSLGRTLRKKFSKNCDSKNL